MCNRVVRWGRSRSGVKWFGRIDRQLGCRSWGTWLGCPLLDNVCTRIAKMKSGEEPPVFKTAKTVFGGVVLYLA